MSMIEHLTADMVHVLAGGQITRIFGPPGTGKTTTLAAAVKRDVANRGADAIRVASFSVTAAREIAGRDTGLRPQQMTTLHALGRRALGGDVTVALDPQVITDWNDRAPAQWRITADARRGDPEVAAETGQFGTLVDDEGAQLTSGDELLGALDMRRARLVPQTQWSPELLRFADEWTAWKNAAGVIDYGDMILHALERALDGEPAPDRPEVLVIDEAQDLTPAEMALALSWGRNLPEGGRLVLAGDDDQAIMEWRGGDPGPLLDIASDDAVEVNDIVLEQSYRIPAAVHAVAESWVHGLSRRREKNYRPRDEVGSIMRSSLTLGDPRFVDRVAEEVEAGRSVMILASCGYMLLPATANLRRAGVPFGNDFRPAEPKWNPLRIGGHGTSTAERVAAWASLMDHNWTGDELRAFMPLLDAKGAGLARGAKTRVDTFDAGEVEWGMLSALWADRGKLEEIIGDDERVPDMRAHLRWLHDHSLKTWRPKLGFPAAVIRRYGVEAVRTRPQVTIGTVHCSPPDEPVLTSTGYVPIGELTPGVHRLVGYSTTGGLTRGTRGAGVDFVRAVNPYDGPLLTIETDRSRTRVTPDHRVRAALADNFFGKWVVYAMRRGSWWRVGHCVSGHRPYRSGGVAGRLATEQADGGWILGVYESKREALLAEIAVQARFGIPGTTFEAASSRAITTADLHRVHDATAGDVGPRAKELLAAYGLDEAAPLYARSNVKINRAGLRHTFLTEARNLLPLHGYVAVPVIPAGFPEQTGIRHPDLLRARVSVEHYVGDVHSLEVLPHHHYVSGGAVVHNSVKGGGADTVFVSPELSAAGHAQWSRGGIERDQVRRLLYVALTRAKRKVVVLDSGSANVVPRRLLLPPELTVREEAGAA